MSCKFLFSIAVVSVIFFGACNNSETKRKEPEAEVNKCTRYACPMHPDRTSTELERCPQCNMPMELLPDSLLKDSIKQNKK